MTSPDELADSAMDTASEDGSPGERVLEPLLPEDLPMLEELKRRGTPVIQAVEDTEIPKD